MISVETFERSCTPCGICHHWPINVKRDGIMAMSKISNQEKAMSKKIIIKIMYNHNIDIMWIFQFLGWIKAKDASI